MEYLLGRADIASRRPALHAMLSHVHPYFLNFTILERYAAIRWQLRPPAGSGIIGDIDTLIAATAVEYGLTVITTDHDFLRVPSLSVQLLRPRTFELVDL